MPHKICEPDSPSASLSNSASSLFDKDALKARRTSTSLSNLSPGKSKTKRRSISVQDLMGGEKKATDINSPGGGSGSLRHSKRSIMSADAAFPVVQAEDKIQNILKARKTRQRRRSDICRSLQISEEFLSENAPHQSSVRDLPDDHENLTIPLNDVCDALEGVEKEGGRRRRRNSGPKSPGRTKRSDVTREQRSRMVRNPESKDKPLTPKKDGNKFLTNASAFSPKSPGIKRSGSVNALRERLRQRLQGAKYCDLGESSSDMSDVEAAPTRTMRRKSISAVSDDECTGDESELFEVTKAKKRSKSKERRARSKSRNRISRKQTEASEDPDSKKSQKSRSKSSNRVRSKSARRRIRKDDIATETEDDASNASFSIDGSRSNPAASGKRGGRRRSSQRDTNTDYTTVSDENTDAEASFEFTQSSSKNSFKKKGRRSSLSRSERSENGKNKPMDMSNSSTESLVVSPGSKKPKKRTKTKKSSQKDEEQSLGSHLESERDSRTLDKDDLSQVTEEQSNSSAQGQPILLQFDPTSDNHVQSVNQDNAKKTSGTIHGSNGTKSRLEIAELGGLPTFEKLNGSDTTGTTESSRYSIDSSTSSHDHTRSFFSTSNVVAKGMSRASSFIPSSAPLVQSPGENTFEHGSQNAEWGDFGDSHSSRQNRSTAKSIFHKAARRGSDLGIGARTSSFGAIRLLGGRSKSRDYNDSIGDGECLLGH